jgi:hypothetical protein
MGELEASARSAMEDKGFRPGSLIPEGAFYRKF